MLIAFYVVFGLWHFFFVTGASTMLYAILRGHAGLNRWQTVLLYTSGVAIVVLLIPLVIISSQL